MRLQEHVEQLAVGSIPRAVTVVLEHDLADSVQAGDRVSVVGWLERKWKPCYRDVRCDVEVVCRIHDEDLPDPDASGDESDE